MKYLKTFEHLEDDLDLRQPTELVKCIKNYKPFIKDEVYELSGMYGDPQKAYDYFKLYYLPMCCVSVFVVKNNNKEFQFRNNKSPYTNQYTMACVGDFNDYFDLLTDEELEFYKNTQKYNL